MWSLLWLFAALGPASQVDLAKARALSASFNELCTHADEFCEAARDLGGFISQGGTFVGHMQAVLVSKARVDCHSNGAYCLKAAWRYTLGVGSPIDGPRAAEMYTKGCKAKGAGCVRLAWLYLDGEGGMPADPAVAMQLYRRSCDADNLDGCCKLGGMLDQGRRVPRDVGRAVALRTKACDGGHTHICTDLGDLYADGDGVPADPAKAFALYVKACDAGHADGCCSRAEAIHDGAGVAKDRDRAGVAFVQACRAGSGRCCTHAGRRVYQNDPKANAEMAAQLFRVACTKDDLAGCAALASLTMNGEGVPRDPAAAVTLAERACQGGSALACAGLGVWYLHGAEGLPPAPLKARAPLEASCAADQALACVQLAWMHQTGTGVPKAAPNDPAVAELLRKACRLGAQAACKAAPPPK